MSATVDVASLPPFDPRPVTLQGRLVRLEPLTMDHLPALTEVAADPDIWTWLSVWPPADPAGRASFMRGWMETALAHQQRGEAIPWATIDLRTGRCVGTTRYLNIRKEHRCVEIGWTWLHSSAHRTGLNTEAKLLQLIHAFDTLGALRVEWRTDERNKRSWNAIERLGAIYEGTMRFHMIRADGTMRNTAGFSAIRPEWPAIRARLEGYLAKHRE